MNMNKYKHGKLFFVLREKKNERKTKKQDGFGGSGSIKSWKMRSTDYHP